MADWELVHQRKKTKINEDNMRENRKRFDRKYKVGDKVMLTNNNSYKYETPYNRPFFIMRCWINDMITLQYDLIKIRQNICRIKPHTSNTNIEDINPKNMCDNVNI